MVIFNPDFKSKFIARPNRFIIIAEHNGAEVICHCPNTGRMKELLYPGADIILEKSRNPDRKTLFTVVAVYKGELIVPITSVRANWVAKELVIPYLYPNSAITQEFTYRNSRFDFKIEDHGSPRFIEVKSCTLFEKNHAMFPDAPTTRGLKHMEELRFAVDEGFKGTVLLIVFNHLAESFSPNYKTDPQFAKTMEAISGKVDVIPFKVKINQLGEVTIPIENPILPLIWGVNDRRFK
ncbi:MAG: DNA/RNA nuclease SfsA [Spirochaetales bacterium]|nr:DNA/RNA nuclease SfsA [Spirochaetales bacterium]